MIGLLRATGEPDDAKSAGMLEKMAASMTDRYSTKETLFRIGEACHPKALGDRQVKGLTSERWLHELEQLEQRCAEAFNALERSGP